MSWAMCSGMPYIETYIYINYLTEEMIKCQTHDLSLTLKNASTLTFTISKVQNFKIKSMFLVMLTRVPGV